MHLHPFMHGGLHHNDDTRNFFGVINRTVAMVVFRYFAVEKNGDNSIGQQHVDDKDCSHHMNRN